MPKKLLKWLFTFDEYMIPILAAFGILFVILIPNNLDLFGSLLGILMMLGTVVGVLLFLHVYQALCRLIGADKSYFRQKKDFLKYYYRFKKYIEDRRKR